MNKFAYALFLILLMPVMMTYTISTFNDSSSTVSYVFSTGGYNTTYGITLPENATISSATMGFSGYTIGTGNWTNATGASGIDYITDIYDFSTTDAHALGYNARGSPGGGCGPVCSTHYRWNGTDWYTYIDKVLYHFDFVTPTLAFAVNQTNKIYAYNGSAWNLNATTTAGNNFTGIDMLNSTIGYAIGKTLQGGLLIYEYDGTGNWIVNFEIAAPGLYVTDLAFVSSTTVYAVGPNYIMRCFPLGNWNSLFFAPNATLLAIDQWAGTFAFAVGENGTIDKWTALGDTWVEATSPLPDHPNSDLYAVDIHNASLAYAVGKSGIIIRWDGMAMPPVAWSIEVGGGFVAIDLYSVESMNNTFVFVGGLNSTFLRYKGYPNKIGLDVGANATEEWNPTKTELSYLVTTSNLTTTFMSLLGLCAPALGNCTIPLNVSCGTIGGVQVSSLNITYGTQLLNTTSLLFNTSTGIDVATNPQYSDTTVYIYNGTTLAASVPTTFSSQPNYTGWNAIAGTTGTTRGYVITDSLLSDAGNTSMKSVYIEATNSSLGMICFWNKTVGIANITGAVNATLCNTTYGGTVLTPSTTDINGVTYFKIDNVNGSGGAQVPAGAGGNNPPVLSGTSVAPATGTHLTTYTYLVTVTDLDNDTMTSMQVLIDGGAHAMAEVNLLDTTTSDGKQYRYRTTLTVGIHTYRFRANDGTVIVTSAQQAGPTVLRSTLKQAAAPGFDFGLVVVLFALSILIFVLRKN